MRILQALVLGAVQGLTEFIPVSSTAHLYLAQWVLGIPNDAVTLSFDVILHLEAPVDVNGIGPHRPQTDHRRRKRLLARTKQMDDDDLKKQLKSRQDAFERAFQEKS